MANFEKNKYVAMSIIDKICGELKYQPGDIMEFVEDEKEAEKLAIEAKIAELQAQLKNM